MHHSFSFFTAADSDNVISLFPLTAHVLVIIVLYYCCVSGVNDQYLCKREREILACRLYYSRS